MECEPVWMFAYGANMCDGVLVARRGIMVLESLPAYIDGYRLCFDLPGVPWLEPVFANIAPAHGERVHGVLRAMSRQDLRRLDAMEASGESYEHIQLDAKAYDGRTIQALAYRALRCRSGERPSQRYLRLLCSGARAHGLDLTYVERLCGTPTAPPVPFAEAIAHAIERGMAAGLPIGAMVPLLWRLVDGAREWSGRGDRGAQRA